MSMKIRHITTLELKIVNTDQVNILTFFRHNLFFVIYFLLIWVDRPFEVMENVRTIRQYKKEEPKRVLNFTLLDSSFLYSGFIKI